MKRTGTEACPYAVVIVVRGMKNDLAKFQFGSPSPPEPFLTPGVLTMVAVVPVLRTLDHLTALFPYFRDLLVNLDKRSPPLPLRAASALEICSLRVLILDCRAVFWAPFSGEIRTHGPPCPAAKID